MNKIATGALAGAAGIALLAGGAGTFAAWNDSTHAGGGTINTGVLTIATTGSADWQDVTDTPSVDLGTQIPTGYRFAPGDTLQFTQDLVIDATGDNLTATLSYVPGSVTGTTGNQPSAAADFPVTVALSNDSADPTAGPQLAAAGQDANGNDEYTVTAATSGTLTVKATVTVSLGSTVSGTTDQSLSGLTLSDAQFHLDEATPAHN